MITCHNAFNVWPETALFPVWHRDTKRLDAPAGLLGGHRKPSGDLLQKLQHSLFLGCNQELEPILLQMYTF